MTRPFEAELKDRGIPYRIFGGLRFYERMEVKDLLAYFNLMVNPNDNVAFERIANVPKRGVGDTSIERIRQEATALGLSEYDYVLHMDQYASNSDVPVRVINALSPMMMKMEETKKKLTDNLEVYSSVLKDFTTDIGYYDYLKDDENPDEDRIGNVNALFDDISHFINSHPDSKFQEYLQNVSLLSAQDDMNGGNYVSLMTIHVAKGLEFDYVFIISMNEGAFPSMRAEMESGRDAQEEERRLAYVAMTRAKKQLYCSCNTAYSYQTDSHAIPSKFFKEAGLTLPASTSFNADSWAHSSWNQTPRPSHSNASSYFADGDAISPFDAKKEAPKKSNRRIMESRIGGLAIGLIMKNSGMAPSPRSSTKTSSLSFLTPRARKPYWHPIQCSLVSCLKEDKHESGRSDRSGQRVDRVAREVQLRILHPQSIERFGCRVRSFDERAEAFGTRVSQPQEQELSHSKSRRHGSV
jgi:ATP-dependent exoDNAse (exonuclease V) beta subunit